MSLRTPVWDWLAYAEWDARVHARLTDRADEPDTYELALDKQMARDASTPRATNPEGDETSL